MDTYKYLKKEELSFQKKSEQEKDTAGFDTSSRKNSAIQRANIGTSDRGLPQEKRAVFDNKLSAADCLNGNGVSGFGISETRARFSSTTPEQRGTHAYTRDLISRVPRNPHGSDNDPSTVRKTRGSSAESSETNADISSLGKTDSSNSRDVDGIKFKKTASAVIQREKLTYKVTDVDPKLSDPAPNPKPTIVFETMTTNSADAQSVFDQTKGYSGNTICIVGLNRKVDNFNDETRNQTSNMDFAVADTVVAGKNNSVHILKCFKFNWKKPSGVGDNAQYQMPFVEARLEVMRQAKNLVQAFCGITGEDESDYSHNFIYRWIDGDARDDTSEMISNNTLQRLGNNELMSVSGKYGWRSGADSDQYRAYTLFIRVINHFERRVRSIYFEYKGSLESQSNDNQHLPDFLPGGNINGVYHI